jgi:ankyrin repeat protein
VDPDPELLASLPPLLRAAAIGDRDAVHRLVRVADVNAAAKDGWTALHAAAVFDHPEVVACLLTAGAVVDARDSDGFTPLLNAANASAAVISMLLEAGADPDARAAIGWRPIHRFAEYGNVDGLRAILATTSHHVDVRDDDEEYDSTALMDAAETGSFACVELLLEAGADPLLKCGGETVADLAAKHGHDEIVSRLRSTGPR